MQDLMVRALIKQGLEILERAQQMDAVLTLRARLTTRQCAPFSPITLFGWTP